MAGSGKTCLMRQLTLDLAENELNHLKKEDYEQSQAMAPLFIQLAEFAKKMSDRATPTMEDYLTRTTLIMLCGILLISSFQVLQLPTRSYCLICSNRTNLYCCLMVWIMSAIIRRASIVY